MTDSRIVGVRSGSRDELLNVAKYQRRVITCVQAQVMTGAALMYFLPRVVPQVAFLLYVGLLLVGLVSSAFVFLLAINVYSTSVGILLGVLGIIPCIGLVVLLAVNGKATSILKQNGIQVGLMGANLSQL
jgi:hypothetical protein